MKIGQLVMLINTDGFMPPLGSIGEIVGFYKDDYDVFFSNHPCPVEDVNWLCAKSWLIPINPADMEVDDLGHTLDAVKEK